MLLDPDIAQLPSMSEVLESVTIRPTGFSDILDSIGDGNQALKDLFAEGGPRKAWHAEHADIARCDLSEEHVHLFPKVGLRIIAIWKRTVLPRWDREQPSHPVSLQMPVRVEIPTPSV